MELAAGTVLQRYTVERTLGAGGMAVVYLARHNQIGSLHAVKVLTLSGPVLKERLLQEGRVQAGLRHPNIVTVTDLVEVDGQPALVLEYVRGPALSALLRQTRPTLAQADALGRGILRGVAAAHRQGLVHRDLKPANVLIQVSDDGLTPKIADFGLGKLVRGAQPGGVTRSGATMGTPAYMAPEQIRDSAAVDERADVFSLGAILYEVLTGQLAFPGEDTLDTFERIASGRYAPLPEHLPERMRAAVEGALAVDRDERFTDAAGLLAAWTGQAEGLVSEPLSDTDLWSREILEAAESLAPSAAESLDSERSPPSPQTPDTFALSIGGTSEGPVEGVEQAGAPVVSLALDPVDRGALGKWTVVGALVAVPFALGGLVAVLGSLQAIRMAGAWATGLFALGVVGGGSLGALAVLWRTGRVSRHLWWLVIPAILATVGNVGTGIGARAVLQGLGHVAPDNLANLAAHSSAVALTTELVGLSLASMLLLVTAEVAAALVLVSRGGVGPLGANRRLATLGVALFLGTGLWLATTLWITQGAVPFVVFLILVGAGIGMAAVSFSTPDPDERTAEMRILTAVAGACGVLAAAKIVWLQQVIGILQGVEAGGGLEAAEQFSRAIQSSGAGLVAAWGAAAAVVALIALSGKGGPKIAMRTGLADLGPLLVLLVPMLGSKFWSDRAVNDLTGEVVPAFLAAEVQRTLGIHLTDRELMKREGLFPAAVDPAARLVKRWRERDREVPEGAIVVDPGEGVLQSEDVILGVDGQRIDSVKTLLAEVQACDCERVIFTVDRGGSLLELHAEVREVREEAGEVSGP